MAVFSQSVPRRRLPSTKPLGWAMLCSCAPLGVLVYALWPPIDIPLVVTCSLVSFVAGGVFCVMWLARVAAAHRGGRADAKLKATVSALMEAATDPTVPMGPLM